MIFTYDVVRSSEDSEPEDTERGVAVPEFPSSRAEGSVGGSGNDGLGVEGTKAGAEASSRDNGVNGVGLEMLLGDVLRGVVGFLISFVSCSPDKPLLEHDTGDDALNSPYT